MLKAQLPECRPNSRAAAAVTHPPQCLALTDVVQRGGSSECCHAAFGHQPASCLCLYVTTGLYMPLSLVSAACTCLCKHKQLAPPSCSQGHSPTALGMQAGLWALCHQTSWRRAGSTGNCCVLSTTSTPLQDPCRGQLPRYTALLQALIPRTADPQHCGQSMEDLRVVHKM